MSPVSHPEGSASLDAQAGEALVRSMFARAWQDGRITKDEQLLLNEVVDFLGMHPDRVRRLSNEARREINAPPPKRFTSRCYDRHWLTASFMKKKKRS